VNLNISPDPISCANTPGGVNSVVYDHAAGFLAAGYTINQGKGLNIIHALSETDDIDVFHCHGLYPIGKGHFDNSYAKANDIVLRNALKAKVTICISEFSADILRHKLHIAPIVLRNGIWTDDYTAAGSPTGPILFPKVSLDANARPDEMFWLKENTNYKLASIARIPTIASMGPLNRKLFLSTLRECSIYLGTTKENNSMATMEAMISGVPIVGYDIGFNSEWLMNGVGCELVPRGDKAALTDAIARVMENWKQYSADARAYAQGVFDWQPVIEQLLEVYDNVGSKPENKSVSIIIPVHNYAKYLPEAIDSALSQTVPCEVIVVDDQSTDESLEIAQSYGDKVRVIANEINLGVAETRNKGIEKANGAFIVCLDADDRLRPDFVEKHLAAFRTNEDAIAYSPINIIDGQGKDKNQKIFRAGAQPNLQAVGRNQIPSCCMFRKSFFLRAGGYDKRYTPAEDANLWLKIFSIGGKPVRASNSPLMDYRAHGTSLSSNGVFPDWWSDYSNIYNMPITERDPNIEIILESNEQAKEILWHLENQSYQNWICTTIQKADNLKKPFPWLKTNCRPSRRKSLLTVEDGTPLPPNFLMQFAEQTPPWIQTARQSP
jgi:glycosyltransferase involved in cell wall biosynthesis